MATPEEQENLKYLKTLTHLNGKLFGRDCYVSVTQVSIEFVCGPKSEYFNVAEKGFKETVSNYLKKHGIKET